MFEWKFKYSRAFIFGICFLILFAYTIVAFIPGTMIVNSFEDEPVRACITGVFLLSLIMLIKEIYRYKHYGLEEEERERREQNGRDEDQV